MPTKKKKPITWYIGKAMNVPATDGLPEGQIFVAYITYDRKLCVQFPNGGQEIYSAQKLEDFSTRHGGWVESNKADAYAAYHGPWNPLHSDLGGSLDELVVTMKENGMSPEAILEGIVARVGAKLK